MTVGNLTMRVLRDEAGGAQLLGILTLFVMREGARTRSRWMPYIKGLLDAHDSETIPMTWDPDDARDRRRFNGLSALSRRNADAMRSWAKRSWEQLMQLGAAAHPQPLASS